MSIRPAVIKSSGYLISSVSVMLLGAVAWKSASKDPVLLACLVAGMVLSIIGMICRWISYQMEE
jgi:hypothetical protein